MWCCNRKKTKSFHTSSKLYNIVNNFEETNIDECTKMDKLNEKMYTNLLHKAQKAENNIKNSSIYMNIEVPPPPRPSNRDKYILWNKRSIHKSVIEQSEAVIFLLEKGFKYDHDYEAYQAVDLALEYKKRNNIKENDVDKSKTFDNVFTQNDTNIMRKKSLKRVNYIYDERNKNKNAEDDEDEDDNISVLDFTENKENEIKNITNITHITTLEPSAPPLHLYPCLNN